MTEEIVLNSRFFNLPPQLHCSSLLGFKRDSFFVSISFSLLREGGPLAVEEIVLNLRFFNLPPQHCCSSLFAKEGQFFTRSDGGDSVYS